MAEKLRITKRMWLRWIVLFLIIAGVAWACVQLGEWQLRRLDERRATNARVVVNTHEDPVPYEQVMDHTIDDEDAWHVVEVTGTYTGETFQVRYRNQNDTAGSEVVSVLRAKDGRHVLINRGFIPRPRGQEDPQPPAAPQGEVRVVGYVQRNERGKDNATVPHERMVRLINSEKIGASLHTELVDGYIGAFEATPADDALLQPMALPSLDEGPHLSYAWQWFAFAVIAVVGVGFLVRADIKDQRKTRQRREELRARKAAGTPASAGDDTADPQP